MEGSVRSLCGVPQGDGDTNRQTIIDLWLHKVQAALGAAYIVDRGPMHRRKLDVETTDRDIPTPRTSGSFALYVGICDVTLRSIATRRSILVDDIREKIQKLSLKFADWPNNAPNILQRTELINELFELRKQVESYLQRER
jgi:hypothetical protein